MKWLVFGFTLIVGVPLMALTGAMWPKMRSWLLSLLIATPVLGSNTSVNFVSMELYRGPDRGFEVTLTDLVTLGLALSLMGHKSGRIKWLPRNSLWAGLLFLMCLVSAVTAPVPLYAGFTLWKMVRMFLIFWTVVNVLRTGTELHAVWRGLVWMAFIMLFWVVKQRYIQGYYRAPGPFDHSNTIPPYLNPIIPVLLIWALVEPRLGQLRRTLTLVAAFALLFAVQSTFSRAGLALAALGVLGALGVANLRAPSQRTAAVTAVVLLGMLLASLKTAPRIIERFLNAPPSSEAARDEFNHAASMMTSDHTFGVGLNQFSHVLTVSPRYNEHITVMANEEQAGVCHHIYWLTAAELGVPGLALFLLVIARFWRPAFWGFWRGRTLEAMLLGGFAMGHLALHVAGLLEWAFRITPVMIQYALSCGIIVALYDRVRAARAAPPSEEGVAA